MEVQNNLGLYTPRARSSIEQLQQAPTQQQPNMGMGSGFGQSAATQNLARALTAQSNQNLAQNVMPGINQGAQQAGQYGGTRQGIAQGVAAGNAQTGLNTSLAGLYSQAYGQDQNFYTQQRGQDQAGVQLGANLYNMGNSGNLGVGAGQYALGQTEMNAPLNAANAYAGVVNPYMNVNGGTNSSHSSTTTNYKDNGEPVGGGWQNALGTGLGIYQGARNMGLGSGGGGTIGGSGYSNPSLGLSGSGGYQSGGGYGSVPYGISS